MSEYHLDGKRVFVAGHRGMVGSACVNRLKKENVNILTANRKELDLTNQNSVRAWMKKERPQVVIVAAAKVGGILANNDFPAEFLYENLMIEANIIEAAYSVGVEKLLFLGSSCIYPKVTQQPISENALLTGALEPTNEWYAIAKIAGIKLCQAYRKQYGADFISAMPSNLYGLNDNFHPTGSHVIPAMMRRFYEAHYTNQDSVTCWGSGQPKREFLFVDDLADACVFLIKHYSDIQHINVGAGFDISIQELAHEIKKITEFKGKIVWDTSKPDGTMLKCMDVSRLKSLGWQAKTSFTDGLRVTYNWFRGELEKTGISVRL